MMKKRIFILGFSFFLLITGMYAQNIDYVRQYMVGNAHQEYAEGLIASIVTGIQNGEKYVWTDVIINQHYHDFDYITVQIGKNRIMVKGITDMQKRTTDQVIIEYNRNNTEELKRLVTNVSAAASWNDVVKYVNAYTKDTGKGYRTVTKENTMAQNSAINDFKTPDYIDKYMVGSYLAFSDEDKDYLNMGISLTLNGFEIQYPYPWTLVTENHLKSYRDYVVVQTQKQVITLVSSFHQFDTFTIKYDKARPESFERLVTNVFASFDYEELSKYLKKYAKKVAQNRYEVY